MDSQPFHKDRGVEGLIGFAVSAPSSVSDVLYLIAAHHKDVLSPDTLRKLDHAHICFIRGDLETALVSVNAVLADLDVSQPAYSNVIAYRMFLMYMVDPNSERWMTDADKKAQAESLSPRVVGQCNASDRHWHSGRLFDGLRLNQMAIHQSGGLPPIWRLYAGILLAKKLTDIHVRYQATKVIQDVQKLVNDSGLHAFEAVSGSLHSALHLQTGNFDEALQSANTATSIAQQRLSTVGVKLAVSVAAMAHLGKGDLDKASASLKLFHAHPTRYILTDSIARSAIVEIALVNSREGPRAAAEQIWAKWHLLATSSACFIEDPSRPAWLVTIARRAGDKDLAVRTIQACEQLAHGNREVLLLETAAENARAAFAGQKPALPLFLDFGADAQSPAGSGHHPPKAGSRPALAGQAEPTRQVGKAEQEPAAAPSASGRGRAGDLPSLTSRENEIALLVGRGMTNQQVAKRLGLSPHTVNFHLRGIFRKLSIISRVQLGNIIAQIDRQAEASFTPDQR